MSDDDRVFLIVPPDLAAPEPSYAHEFYEAIGRFSVTWGGMETHLEALLRMAINIEGKTPERLFQINLGRKIDQLKDICRDCPALKPLESAVRNISPTIKQWGQDRDFLIHSILVGFSDGPPRKIILRHVEHPKGVLIQPERGEFSLEIINGFTQQVKDLHRHLIPILKQAAALQDPERVRKASLLTGQVARRRLPFGYDALSLYGHSHGHPSRKVAGAKLGRASIASRRYGSGTRGWVLLCQGYNHRKK